ncbi:hypothetical protein HY003_03285 [Candidatus Saccharibacteria bacterium]|nr:hypothetical protein [Candidatus Saccharibacteria bacterium]MBI3338299.1 hypothetical protein [Candidatus Saccharibacteria bacterium]
MAEGEVAIATSTEDRPLPAKMNWSGDGGALRQVQSSSNCVVYSQGILL